MGFESSCSFSDKAASLRPTTILSLIISSRRSLLSQCAGQWWRFIPTLSISICSTYYFVNSNLWIPIWSMLTKWEVDEVGRLYTFNHCYRSVNFLAQQSSLLSGDDKTVWFPWVWWNSCQFVFIPNLKSSLYCSRLQPVSNIASNTRRDWLQGRVDLNSPLGGFPSSGH